MTKPCDAAGGGTPGTATVERGADIVMDESVMSSGMTNETSRSTRSNAMRCDRFVLTAESQLAS